MGRGVVACLALQEVDHGGTGPGLSTGVLGGADRGLSGPDPAAQRAAGAGLPREAGAAAARAARPR